MKEIPLTNGKFSQVDDEDFEMLSAFSWCHDQKNNRAFRSVYLPLSKGARTLRLHTVIMKTPPGLVVDHIDGNPLNNQKNNLRICTRAENSRNRRKSWKKSSQYKGVSWDKTNKKWVASIRFDRRLAHLGSFSTEIEAAKTYNAAAIRLHGKYARLNVTDGK